MECLVATRIEWSVGYRRGYSIKFLLVLKGYASDCDEAGKFADGTRAGKTLLRNGYQQIVVWPVV